MIKSTDIFKLEKWWVKKITLIVAALVLTGCQSQAMPTTATATSTSTEIPATATLLSTDTPVPTATATELVLPDNAVEIVGGGYAYVENGRLMLLRADSLAKEVKDPSYDVVFNTMDDAKMILKELNPEAINVTADDFFQDGEPSELSYGWTINKSAWRDMLGESGARAMDIAGIVEEFARVKNPIPGELDLGMAFLSVYGYRDFLPVPMVSFDESGRPHNLIGGTVASYSPDGYAAPGEGGTVLEYAQFKNFNWSEIQRHLRGNILYFHTVTNVSPDKLSLFTDEPTYLTGDFISPEMSILLDMLLQRQAERAGVLGYNYINSSNGGKATTGEVLDAVDETIDGNFYVAILRGPVTVIVKDDN